MPPFHNSDPLPGSGVARSSTPVPSVNVAWKNNCPRSFKMALLELARKEFGIATGGDRLAIVPTSRMTVPVLATSRTTPPERTYKTSVGYSIVVVVGIQRCAKGNFAGIVQVMVRGLGAEADDVPAARHGIAGPCHRRKIAFGVQEIGETCIRVAG